MKEIYQLVHDRADGECEICESSNKLELHHAVGGNGKRKQHQTEDTCFLLCWECHRGDYGCHGRDGHQLNLTLKLIAQERMFDKGLNEDQVRKKMGGRLYSGQVIPSRKQNISF